MDTAGSVYNFSGMGMPFGTGVMIFLIISLGLLAATIYATHDKEISKRIYEGKAADLNAPKRIVGVIAEWTLGLPFTLYRLIFANGKHNPTSRQIVNTMAWSVAVIIIGFSSYAMIVIRAKAGTPINENDPSSVASMISYLKREQYGDRPLFRGVRYNDAQAHRKSSKSGKLS